MARRDGSDRVKRIALGLMLLAASASVAAGKAKRAPKPAPAAPAAPDSPAAVLAELPALPKAARTDLDCSTHAALDQRIERIRKAAAEQAPDTGSGDWREPTDEQQQALLALNDLDFSACVSDLGQRPADLWIEPLQEKLDTRLASAQDNAHAIAAATQFLKDAQPAYAAYLREVGDCVGRRERIVATARAAHAGNAVENALLDATEADWALVGNVADAQDALCASAKAAAARFSGDRAQ